MADIFDQVAGGPDIFDKVGGQDIFDKAGEQAGLQEELKQLRERKPVDKVPGAEAGYQVEQGWQDLKKQTGGVARSLELSGIPGVTELGRIIAGPTKEVEEVAIKSEDTFLGRLSNAYPELPFLKKLDDMAPGQTKFGKFGNKMLDRIGYAFLPGTSEIGKTGGDRLIKEAKEEQKLLNQQMEQTVTESFGGEVVRAATSIVPSFAAGLAGFPAAVAAAGLQGFGAHIDSAMDNYMAQGMSKEEAYNNAFLDASVVGGTTALVTKLFGPTGVERLASLGLSNVAKTTIAKYLGGVAKGAGLEATEEGIQQFIEGMVEKGRSNPDKTWADIFKESFKSFIIGGILGGGIDATVSGAEALAGKVEEKIGRKGGDKDGLQKRTQKGQVQEGVQEEASTQLLNRTMFAGQDLQNAAPNPSGVMSYRDPNTGELLPVTQEMFDDGRAAVDPETGLTVILAGDGPVRFKKQQLPTDPTEDLADEIEAKLREANEDLDVEETLREQALVRRRMEQQSPPITETEPTQETADAVQEVTDQGVLREGQEPEAEAGVQEDDQAPQGTPLVDLWDRKTGAGETPNQQEIGYRGFTKLMPISVFKSLVPPRDTGKSSIEWLKEQRGKGGKFAPPFLQVKWDEENNVWKVYGHEGRTRSDAVLDEDGDVVIPVDILPDNRRRKSITPEMENAPFVPEPKAKGTEPIQIIDGAVVEPAKVINPKPIQSQVSTEEGYVFRRQPDGSWAGKVTPDKIDVSYPSFDDMIADLAGMDIRWVYTGGESAGSAPWQMDKFTFADQQMKFDLFEQADEDWVASWVGRVPINLRKSSRQAYIDLHRTIVEQAYKTGKPVPDFLVKEYDLTKIIKDSIKEAADDEDKDRPQDSFEQAVSERLMENPRFRGWFEGAELVDKDGNPIIFYHGTKQDITTFKGGIRFADGLLFFTEDPKFAGEHAMSMGRQPRTGRQKDIAAKIREIDKAQEEYDKTYDESREDEEGYVDNWLKNAPRREQFWIEMYEDANVIPVVINAKKVFDPRSNIEELSDLIKEENLEDAKETGAWAYFESREVVERLNKLGYDAIRISESSWTKDFSTIAIWDNRNVKSVFNTTFGTTSDIRYSKGDKSTIKLRHSDGKTYTFRVDGTQPRFGRFAPQVLVTPESEVPGVTIGSTVTVESLGQIGYEVPTFMDIPANITLTEQAQIESANVEKAVIEALGLDALPETVIIVNEPGSKHYGYYEDGHVFLNSSQLTTTEEVVRTLLEEGLHGAWEDPAVIAAWNDVIQSLTEEDIIAQRKITGDEADYNEVVEEAAVRKIVDGLGPLHLRQGFWSSIFRAIKRMFGSVGPVSEQLRDAAIRNLKEGSDRKGVRYSRPDDGTTRSRYGVPHRDDGPKNFTKDDLGIGRDNAVQWFTEAGFDNVYVDEHGFVRLDDFLLTDKESEPSLRRLLKKVEDLIKTGQRTQLPDKGYAFFDSVNELALDQKIRLEVAEGVEREDVPDGVYDLPGITDDPVLIDKLFTTSHLPRQWWGAEGRMMTRNPERVLTEARNYKSYVADHIQKALLSEPGKENIAREFIELMREEFGDQMTPEMVDEVVEGGFKDKIEKLLEKHEPEIGSPVYRMVQQQLKTKKPPKLSTELKNAMTKEAVDHIMEIALKNGVKPPKPHEKLTPAQKLVHMVTNGTAQQIEDSVHEAIRQAERNAARGEWAKGLAMEGSELQSYIDAYNQYTEDPDLDVPEEFMPTEGQVERGLMHKDYAHWKVIRNNLLEYSPVSESLLRATLRQSFTNLKFEEGPIEEEVDAQAPKINLRELAMKPREEIVRVIDIYLDLLSSQMSNAGSSLRVRARVLQDIQKKLYTQIAGRRQELVNYFLAEEDTKILEEKKKKTEEEKQADRDKAEERARERVAQLINVVEGLDGVDLIDFVHKQRVQRLLPKMSDLIKQIYETPFDRHDHIADRFANEMVEKLGLPKRLKSDVSRMFRRAFWDKFKKAREEALKRALEKIAPENQVVIKQKKKGVGLYEWIARAENAGWMSSDDLIIDFAERRGWKVPTPKEVKRFRRWMSEEKKLRTLTSVQWDRINKIDNPVEKEKQEKIEREARLESTRLQRQGYINKIEAQLKAWAKPIADNPYQYLTDKTLRYNTNAAMQEILVSNILARPGGIIRQAFDIGTVALLGIPTRAFATSRVRYLEQLALAENPEASLPKFWDEFATDMIDAFRARKEAFQITIDRLIMGLQGKGIPKNIESLQSGMAAADRALQKAVDLKEKGENFKAAMMSLYNFQLIGFKVFGALDAVQAQSATWQEAKNQARNFLRTLEGKSEAEINTQMDEIFGDINVELASAIEFVKANAEADGIELSKSELRSSAWDLVVHRAYQKLGALGAPVDEWLSRNENYAKVLGWNYRPQGPGGIVARATRSGAQVAHHIIPFPPAAFGNAMGISLNRALTWGGFGLLPELFSEHGKGENWDPSYATKVDRMQRKAEAVTGLSIMGLFFALIAAGVAKVRLAWPRDEREREEWRAKNISPYTVEFNIGGGKAFKMPLRIGPLAPMAGGIAFAGEMSNIAEKRAEKRKKLQDEATRLGIQPGDLPPVSMLDVFGAAGAGAWSMMTGGRTAAGLIGTYSNFGTFHGGRMASGFMTPMVPGLPAYQELTRMAGISVDMKTANLFDLMVPLPTSPQRLNMLGDPVATPEHAQRILGILTLGGGVTKKATDEVAYANVFGSGYRPPAISPAQGYNFNGIYRPMTKEEIARYTKLRGQLFKQALTEMGPLAVSDPEARNKVSAAFRAANQEALRRVGVTLPESGSTSSGRTQRGGSRQGRSTRRTRRPRRSRYGRTSPRFGTSRGRSRVFSL